MKKTILVALCAIFLSTTAHARGLFLGRNADNLPAGVSAGGGYSGSALVAEALRYEGSGKFTRLPGAWCADAVTAWLRAIGRPGLNSRMAQAAISYGPLEIHPHPGDLVVMRTRRGPYGHVGVVVADLGDEIILVSGNWGGRVVKARIPRRSVTAFVKV